MIHRYFLLCAVLLAWGGSAAAQQTSCDVDRARLLALDENQFDQDMTGGWRQLADRPGCNLAAADLLRDYRQAHHNQAGILYWHEGQLRAFAGQSAEAATLMEQSRKPVAEDRAGWNQYVDATIAFLRQDRAAFGRALSALAAVVPPTGKDVPPVVDGYMEVSMADGQTIKIRWPPNIDVVEGLQQCFDQPYETAYGSACRPAAK